ncbi:hypothetical protein [Gemmatimonas sp.]|uniref:hypothetical protein n=1 Tax=Gemmatimonas sp. TaxID=1962908 RepID=UPI00286E5203|nr:hypothetical protein [Gemmatimonas sp.]
MHRFSCIGCARVMVLLFLWAPSVRAQVAVHGTKLSPDLEVAAITSSVRSVAKDERVELLTQRICRDDVLHSDCPPVDATTINGRLPMRVWGRARNELNADKSVGKHHGSMKEATFAMVQRPVALGDTIVILMRLSRPNRSDGPPSLFFDIVLRTDSTGIRVVRSSTRTQSPFPE